MSGSRNVALASADLLLGPANAKVNNTATRNSESSSSNLATENSADSVTNPLAQCELSDSTQNKESLCLAPKSNSKNAKRKAQLRNCLVLSQECASKASGNPKPNMNSPHCNNSLPVMQTQCNNRPQPIGPHTHHGNMMHPPGPYQGHRNMPHNMPMGFQRNHMPPGMGFQGNNMPSHMGYQGNNMLPAMGPQMRPQMRPQTSNMMHPGRPMPHLCTNSVMPNTPTPPRSPQQPGFDINNTGMPRTPPSPMSPLQPGYGIQTAIITKRTVRVSNFTPRGNFVYQHVQNTVSMQNVQVPQSGSQTYYNNMMQHPLFGQNYGNQQFMMPPTGQMMPQSLPNQKGVRTPIKIEKPKENFRFEPYLSLQEVEIGLKNKKLSKGVLRVNPKQYKFSFVSDDAAQQDIFIDGLMNRNRAFDGDIVVVEILDKAVVEAQRAMRLSAQKDKNKNGLKNKKTTNDKLEVQEVQKGPEEEESIDSFHKSQRHGKVVHIVEKMHSRVCVGYLKLMPDKNKTMALFYPRDYRVPNLNIACTSWPDNFYKEHKTYERVLFEAKVLDWSDTRFAIGMIKSTVGKAGDVEAEHKAILLQNDLNDIPFEGKEPKLYPNVGYTIPFQEIQKREDCRKMCIFAIDPDNCRDIDDAVSCRVLENGNLEVGVHISDVSHYLAEQSELDEFVSKKATTIYLVGEAIHMLPDDLCVLCSLFPGLDKLAFSVFFEITKDAEVLNHRFTRSVIHSCAQLSYQQAQAILENKTIAEIDLPDVVNGYTFQDVVETVKNLGDLSVKLREKRFKGGALKLDRNKVKVKLNADGFPEELALYEIKESNRLIEEFMLLANTTVANRIKEDFPTLAYLRCHGPPQKFMMNELIKCLKPLDIDVDFSSAGALHEFLLSIGNEGYGKAVALNMLCSKAMSRAKYYCAGKPLELDGTAHYALNVPLYTHFTSPIRRYSDIMVHRLLAASLKYREEPTWSIEKVDSIAKICNKNKYNAKRAYEMSVELYTKKYIELNSPVTMSAVVIDVKEKYFDVIVLDLDFNRRVFIKTDFPGKIKFIACTESRLMGKLNVQWNETDKHPAAEQIIQVFEIINVTLEKSEDCDKVDCSLARP